MLRVGLGDGEQSYYLPAEDEADAGVGPPPSRRERAAAAEASADHHDHRLAGEQQQQRADAVRGGRVGAVHAEGPAVHVHAHVRLRDAHPTQSSGLHTE